MSALSPRVQANSRASPAVVSTSHCGSGTAADAVGVIAHMLVRTTAIDEIGDRAARDRCAKRDDLLRGPALRVRLVAIAYAVERSCIAEIWRREANVTHGPQPRALTALRVVTP